MKRVILKIALIIGLISSMLFVGSCASCSRQLKSCNSDISGGLHRVVNVYDYQGDLLATYEGKIDIDNNTNGSIMFDIDGKRYVYYNAIIEVIEK